MKLLLWCVGHHDGDPETKITGTLTYIVRKVWVT